MPGSDVDWPCGLVTTGGDGVISDVNETFLRWTGFSAADLIGTRRLRDLLTVGGRIFYETHLNPLLVMQGEVSEVAVDIVARNGATLSVLVNATAADGIARFALFPAIQRRSYERELLEARRLAEEAGAASERVQRRLSLMADVNLVLSGTLSLSTALDRLATLLAAERHGHCVILTVDERDGARRVAVAAAAHADPEQQALSARVAEAMAEGAGRVDARPHPNLSDGFDLPGADGSTLSLGPLAVVPVRAREEHVATLVLAREAHHPAYTRDDVLHLATMAEPIGLFIDNLRLYAREHNRALALQEALLTPAVDIPGVELVTRYLPSADGATVGGDWYDSLIRADGSAVIAIGDVIGHDHRAAAAMGQLRGLLRAIAYTAASAPADILAATDRAARGLGVGCIATAVVVTFDGADPERLVWASAGHPPPAVVSADGTVRLLDDKPDLLLGVRPGVVRHDHEHPWGAGDTLLMYTDGLIENQYRSVDTGLEMLVATLREVAGLPLGQLCEQLISRMSAGHRSDDIAVLAVRSQGRVTTVEG